MSNKMKAYQNNDSNDTRLAVLEKIAEQTSQTLIRLEQKMDIGFAVLDKKIDYGLNKLDKKMEDGFERLDKKIDKLDDKLENYHSETRKEINDVKKELIDIRKDNFSHFKWTIGIILSTLSILVLPNIKFILEYIHKLFTG